MQRNGVISLRPALGLSPMLRDLTGIDPGAAYGCVDWYPYREVALAARPARGEPPLETVSAPGKPAAAGTSPSS